MKFKVSDKVKNLSSPFFLFEEVLTIIRVDEYDTVYPYYAKGIEEKGYWVQENEIKSIEDSKNERNNSNMKIFESPNRKKYLEDLCLGDYFKFMSGAFKGSFGIVCNYTKNTKDHMKDGEKFTDKDPCLIFTDDVPFPVFSFEDGLTEVKKLSGKTIFEED